MFKTLLFLFVGMFLNEVSSFNPLMTYTARFKKMTMHPNVSGEYVIDQVKGNQVVNANLTFKSNKTTDSIVTTFYRCKPEGIDCEYWQTWKFNDFCSKLKEKNQLWSRWYDSFHPPMVCPLDKVNYMMVNGTFDVGSAILLYPEVTDYQWKVTQKFYARDEYIGGYTIESYFFGYRKRPSKHII